MRRCAPTQVEGATAMAYGSFFAGETMLGLNGTLTGNSGLAAGVQSVRLVLAMHL